jgi:hypothetical protein
MAYSKDTIAAAAAAIAAGRFAEFANPIARNAGNMAYTAARQGGADETAAQAAGQAAYTAEYNSLAAAGLSVGGDTYTAAAARGDRRAAAKALRGLIA